ncbi:hypothetical protein GCM10018952_67830 [Streptosporangium vulgare]
MAEALRKVRLERAIGVIYRPQTERRSHYFQTRVSEQFDAVIHIDETRAVEPLERTRRLGGGGTAGNLPVRRVTRHRVKRPARPDRCHPGGRRRGNAAGTSHEPGSERRERRRRGEVRCGQGRTAPTMRRP